MINIHFILRIKIRKVDNIQTAYLTRHYIIIFDTAVSIKYNESIRDVYKTIYSLTFDIIQDLICPIKKETRIIILYHINH